MCTYSLGFRRSRRVLRALALNVPVVTESWLYRCLDAEKWVDPRDSESESSVSMVHPRFGARIMKQGNLLYQASDLLKNRRVYTHRDSKTSAVVAPNAFIIGLARLCGATVVRDFKCADVAIIGIPKFCNGCDTTSLIEFMCRWIS